MMSSSAVIVVAAAVLTMLGGMTPDHTFFARASQDPSPNISLPKQLRACILLRAHLSCLRPFQATIAIYESGLSSPDGLRERLNLSSESGLKASGEKIFCISGELPEFFSLQLFFTVRNQTCVEPSSKINNRYYSIPDVRHGYLTTYTLEMQLEKFYEYSLSTGSISYPIRYDADAMSISLPKQLAACIVLHTRLECSHPFQATVDLYENDRLPPDGWHERMNLNSKNRLSATSEMVFCISGDKLPESSLRLFFVVTEQTCVEPLSKFAKKYYSIPNVTQGYRTTHKLKLQLDETNEFSVRRVNNFGTPLRYVAGADAMRVPLSPPSISLPKQLTTCMYVLFRLYCSHPFQATVEFYENDLSSHDGLRDRLTLNSGSFLSKNDYKFFCFLGDKLPESSLRLFFVVTEQTCVEPLSKFADRYYSIPNVTRDYCATHEIAMDLEKIDEYYLKRHYSFPIRFGASADAFSSPNISLPKQLAACILLRAHLSCTHPFEATIAIYESGLSSPGGFHNWLNLNSGSELKASDAMLYCISGELPESFSLQLFFTVRKQTCLGPSSKFAKAYYSIPNVMQGYLTTYTLEMQLENYYQHSSSTGSITGVEHSLSTGSISYPIRYGAGAEAMGVSLSPPNISLPKQLAACILLSAHLSCSHPFEATIEVYENDLLPPDGLHDRLNLNSESGLEASDAMFYCISGDKLPESSSLQLFFIVTEQTCVEPLSKFAKKYYSIPYVTRGYCTNYTLEMQLEKIEEYSLSTGSISYPIRYGAGADAILSPPNISLPKELDACILLSAHLSCSHQFQAVIEVYENDLWPPDGLHDRLNLNSESGLEASDAMIFCISGDKLPESSSLQFFFVVTEQNCVEPRSKFAKKYYSIPNVTQGYCTNYALEMDLDKIDKYSLSAGSITKYRSI